MPDFPIVTTIGEMQFHQYLVSDETRPITILISHPHDFTPVCTTELGRCHSLEEEFSRRGVKLIGLSCDSVEDHRAWSRDILANQGESEQNALSFPIIADLDRSIATMLGMLDPEELDSSGLALPARALVVIGPDKRVKLSILYPATTGRNFVEVLRVLDSMRLTTDLKLATPVDWRPGDRCVVAPQVSTEDARKSYQNLEVKSLPSGRGYLRYVDPPDTTAVAAGSAASAAP